jgi:hypothetical protein
MAASPAVALSGGVAQWQTSSLSVGTYSVTAQYSGDTRNSGSQSSPITQVSTGTVNVTVFGSDSTLTHVSTVQVTLQ